MERVLRKSLKEAKQAQIVAGSRRLGIVEDDMEEEQSWKQVDQVECFCEKVVKYEVGGNGEGEGQIYGITDTGTLRHP